VVSEYTTGGATFKLTPSGGSAITLKITADTQITIHGTATFANGQTVRVVSAKDSSGADVALRVVVPASA
jgi:hypothetical protein